MLKFSRTTNYEPSKQILKFWLWTRKSKYQVGLDLPGLFQTFNFTLDTLGFLIVIICEVIGLVNLMRVAKDFHIIYAIGLFVADLIFAILYHLPKGSQKRVANEMVLTTDTNRQEDLNQSLFTGKALQIFSAVMIILIACFKVWAFWGFHPKTDGLSFFILLCYAVAATLHLICSGYFLFECVFKLRVAYHHSFSRKQSPRNLRIREFTTTKSVREHNVDPHSLKIIETLEGGLKKIRFETSGVLEDSDLHLFIEHQTGLIEKQLIATKGLELQMETIGINLTNKNYE